MKEAAAFLLLLAIIFGAFKTFYIPSDPTVGKVFADLYAMNADRVTTVAHEASK